MFDSDVRLIVNMCNSVEDPDSMDWFASFGECSQYWPLTSSQVVTDEVSYEVRLVSRTTIVEDVLTSSKLTLSRLDGTDNDVNSREVTLLHFSGWPDLYVPYTSKKLNGFRKMMQELVTFYVSPSKQESHKALVHC